MTDRELEQLERDARKPNYGMRVKIIKVPNNILPQIQRRFWSKVAIGGQAECWGWQACQDDDGYGIFQYNRQAYKAHRFAYYLQYGQSPDGLIIHSCDNPPCCNPEHLTNGTPAQNAADMVQKGRSAQGDWHPSRLYPERRPRGERVWKAKLTADQIKEIRQLYASGRYSYAALARRYQVSHGLIGLIVRRCIWRHVDD